MNASFVTAGGVVTRVPGVYVDTTKVNSGSPGQLDTGTVAVLGHFPFLKPATPAQFSSRAALRRYHDEVETALVAKLAFDPSQDPRVPAGASRLVLVNAGTGQAASLTLDDGDGDASLTLTSQLHGSKGNQLHVSIKANADDAQAFDVTIFDGLRSVSRTGIQSGDLAQVYYEGSDLTRTTLTVGPLRWVWDWERDLALPGDGNSISWIPSDLVSAAALELTLANGLSGASGGDVTVTIVGKNASGADVTEVRTAVAGGVAFDQAQTTAVFSSITSVVVACGDDADYDGTVTVAGVAYDLDTTQFPYLAQVLDHIEQDKGKGFRAITLLPVAGSIPASPSEDLDTGAGGADAQVSVNVLGANKMLVRADLWALAQELDSAGLVRAQVAAGASLPPAPYSGRLLGGTQVAPTLTSWTAALASIERQGVRYVVPLTEDVAVHQAAITHAKRAAIYGVSRHVFVGATKGQSLTQLRDNWAAKLGSPYVSLVGQEIRVVRPSGLRTWAAPMYLAVMLAGAAAGTAPGTPLTSKRLDVLDIRSAWDPKLDAESAIAAGIIQLEPTNTAPKVTRGRTTWLTSDDRYYGEHSAWESIGVTNDFVRQALLNQIGERTSSADAMAVRGLVISLLEQAVNLGYCRSFDPASVEVRDSGDALYPGYKIVPTEGRNFIVIEPEAVPV